MTLEIQNKLVNAYVLQIKNGIKTIDDIPDALKELVRLALI